MKNAFQLPRQIYQCLEYFAPADRGMAYSAIFAYIDTGAEPGSDISPAARGAFEFARRIIDPILLRRKRAAKRRAAKRQALQKLAETSDQSENSDKSENSENSDNSEDYLGIRSYLASLKPTVPFEHIQDMAQVVAMVNSRSNVPRHKREAKIRSELHRRYPGLYSDIAYDCEGRVTLIPAS